MNTTNCGPRNNSCQVATFNPFAEFERELDRAFGLGLSGGSPTPNTAGAPLDVREDAEQLTLTVDLPGVRREDIQISFNDGVLTLGAERKDNPELKEESYLRRERYVGRFERRLTVRTPIHVEGIKAAYRDGVLTVTLPKSEAAKPKQISVSE
jgi:HSP20 family protein